MSGKVEDTKTDMRTGYLRLAIVLAFAGVLLALGMAVAHKIAPSAGQTCFMPNATAHDGSGHTMQCKPTAAGAHRVVWRYPPAA